MQELNKRYRIKVTKLNELRYLSHLDWQSLIIKTFRRMGLKLAMSQGFNPTPRISLSPALPIFIESECELIYFETVEAIPDNFKELFEKNISDNVKLVDLIQLKSEIKRPEPMETLIAWAQYRAIPTKIENTLPNFDEILYNTEKCLSKDDLFITKINKKRIEKTINYRKSLHSIKFENGVLEFTLKTGQDENLPAFRADEFLSAVYGSDTQFDVKRIKFLDRNFMEI